MSVIRCGSLFADQNQWYGQQSLTDDGVRVDVGALAVFTGPRAGAVT
jgi:hypothetical protein